MAITVLQEKESQNISVYVRVRPLSPSINAADWEFKERSISHARNGCKKDYVLDNVFRESKSTADVYQHTTQPLVKTVLDGFSCTVFAYGQTNSGKTFTMRGTGSEDGIVDRAVNDLFDKLKQHRDRQFCLRASYMEIYNEEVNDLLKPVNTNLSIKLDQDGEVMVAGLSEVLVYSKEDVMKLLTSGDSKRHIGETKMNDKSSRSHSIFKMVVESRPIDTEGNQENTNAIDSASFAVKIGVLNLVDLAGSERVTKTGAEGSRLKEGANINKSLLTLGLVIKSLSEGASQAGRHIPYRDSKLTRILQPSLGGNAKTVIICMMTPEAAHVDEGHNTLEFATRAKKVVNEVAAVETMTSAALLKRQANEIKKLTARLCEDGSENVAKETQELQQKLLNMEKANQIQAASIDTVTKEKAFFEKRNMDLMAANKRAQKRSRSRRETIAHFGAVTDREDDVASPCSGTTRDSEMSLDAGASGDVDLTGALAVGGCRSVLPAIGEDNETQELTDVLDDVEGAPKKRQSHGSYNRSRPASAGGGVTRSSAGGASVQRRKASMTVEPFADELRGHLREVKAQLAERDSALAAATADLAAVRAQIEQLNSEKETVQGELTKVQFALQRVQYERRSQAASEEKVAEENEMMRKCMEEAVAKKDELLESLQNYKSSIAAVMEERDSAARDAAARIQEAQEARLTAEQAADKADVDLKLHQERDRRRLEELEALAAEARELREARDEAVRGASAAGEGSSRAAQQLQDAHEEIDRLKSHVSDLESRKRPPLYQRKQEEELKAASEHAAACEARTSTAEAALKEAQEELAAATKDVALLRAEAERAAARHTEQVDEWQVKWEYDVNEAKTTASKVVETLREENEDLRDKVEFLTENVVEAEKTLASEQAASAAKVADLQAAIAEHLQALEAERGTSREWEEALENQNESVAKLEDEVATCERDLEAAKTDAEAKQAAAAQEKQEMVAAHAAALAAAAATQQAVVAELNAAVTAAKEELATQLSAVKEEHADLQRAAAEEHAQALAIKEAEVGSLGSHVHKLQEKLDESPAAFKALAELKELRVKYKQDIGSLNSQLKTANMSSKGGDKAKQLLQRELEKLQKKLSETDVKLRNASTEKQQLSADKATMERKIKQMEMQVAKLSKDSDKKEQSALKKLETAQETLTKVKDDLAKVEAKYAKVRDDNVRGTAAKGVLESRVATLEEQNEESQRLFKECERQLRDTQEENMKLEMEHSEKEEKWEADAANHAAEISRLTEAVRESGGKVAELTAQLDAASAAAGATAERLAAMETENGELAAALQDAEEAARTEEVLRAEVERALADATAALEDWRTRGAALDRSLAAEKQGAAEAAQRHTATAAELQEQLRARAGEVAELRAAVAEKDAALAQQRDDLARVTAERDAAQDEAQDAHTRAEDAQAELRAIQERLADATQAVVERKAELQARATVMDAHERRMRELEQDLAQSKREASTLKGSHGEQLRHAEEARAAAVAKQRQLSDELHSALREAGNDAAAARQAATAQAAALRDAQASVAWAEAAREDLAAEIKELQDQVKTLSADAQALRRQVADAKNVEAGLRSREDLARRRVAEVNEVVEEHVRTNEALQESMAKTQTELRKVKAELAMIQLNSHLSVPGGSLQGGSESSGAEDEIRGLRENISTLTGRLTDALEQRGAVVADLQRAEAEAQQASATAAAMREAARDAESRVAELEAEVSARAEALAREREAGSDREKELTQVQAELHQAKMDLAKWNDTYLMQKQISRKLEAVQGRLQVVMHKDHGVPEQVFADTVVSVSAEYDRLYVKRQEMKRRKAAAQAAAQAQQA